MKTVKQLVTMGLLFMTLNNALVNEALASTVLHETCEHQNNVNSPFRPVQELFAAVSAFDHDRMRAAATDDFQLLEVGEDWNMDDFVNVVKPNPYTRRNYFAVIKTNINENFAWVSYWNKATYAKTQPDSSEKQKLREVAWLESAIMIRTKAGWKVQMMHSTRIKAEDLPKSLQLCEFVG